MAKKANKDERIKAEYDRLSRYYQTIPEKQRATVEHLIQNSAFLVITLQDLQEKIKKNGVVDVYQNGANQHGVKQSAELQAYNQTLKNYQTLQKQLLNLLPAKGSVGKSFLTGFLQQLEPGKNEQEHE